MVTADLIARLESADAGSRDLDAEMALALGWTRDTHPPTVLSNSYTRWEHPNGATHYQLDGGAPPFSRDLTTIVAEGERHGLTLDQVQRGQLVEFDKDVYQVWWSTSVESGIGKDLRCAAAASLLRALARETGEAG